MNTDLLEPALLLLAPAVPATVIFAWANLDANRDPKRNFRRAAAGYGLSLLVASAITYGLALSASPESQGFGATIAMQTPSHGH